MPEGRIKSIIGKVVGTTASSSIEHLLGSRNKPHIEESIKCEEGQPWVMVKFDPFSQLEDNVSDTSEQTSHNGSTEESDTPKDDN